MTRQPSTGDIARIFSRDFFSLNFILINRTYPFWTCCTEKSKENSDIINTANEREGDTQQLTVGEAFK